MKTRNKLLTLLILSAGAATTTALINKAIKLSATSRNVLGEPEALCYKWRLGNIHYTKSGAGKPILLVHDLSPASAKQAERLMAVVVLPTPPFWLVIVIIRPICIDSFLEKTNLSSITFTIISQLHFFSYDKIKETRIFLILNKKCFT